jgi:hypothetical protein
LFLVTYADFYFTSVAIRILLAFRKSIRRLQNAASPSVPVPAGAKKAKVARKLKSGNSQNYVVPTVLHSISVFVAQQKKKKAEHSRTRPFSEGKELLFAEPDHHST